MSGFQPCAVRERSNSHRMLRLKQIDILGFKSFCNRERLRFPGRGIAAVVGPNGCGKSNICDATNWVLGEQSAKSLRGSRMHDVIFNGTSTRKPAGLATVTLTLHDPSDTLARLLGADRQAQAAQVPPGKTQGEIAVTRKLFRSGESRYIVNGKAVRLRDVQDLFLGSGLGPNHYAIIEQGRIGQLLSSRPLDRRAFVEEAAGVTRFKARRKLAELKLSNASLNLERVHDILQEVQRQGDSLKRQAARAERYERYRQELREALSLVLAYRYRRIEAERTRLETASKTAAKRLRELSAETERMDAEFSAKRTFEQHWEVQLETERDELTSLRIEGERLRERVEQQSRAAASNESRCEQAVRDLEGLAERLQAGKEDLVAERQGLAAMAEAAERLHQRLDAKERECRARDAAVADLLRQQEACQADLLQTLNAISNARTRLGRLNETLSACSRQAQRARARREDAAARLGQAAQKRTELEAEAHKLGEALAGVAERRRSLQDSLETRRAEREVLRKDAEAARAEVSRLTAKRDSLRELLAHRAYAAETVKDIFDLLERSPRPDFQPLGILADFLEVDEGFEKIVEQFLGDDLEYVVVGSWGEARCGLPLGAGRV